MYLQHLITHHNSQLDVHLCHQHCVILFILIKHRHWKRPDMSFNTHIREMKPSVCQFLPSLVWRNQRLFWWLYRRNRRTEQAQKHNEKHIAEIQTAQGNVGKRSHWDGNWPNVCGCCVFSFSSISPATG